MVVVGAGFSIKVVEAVVFVLLRLPRLGMLTTWPLVIDIGRWMSSGWPVATMPLPGAVFSSRVPVGL